MNVLVRRVGAEAAAAVHAVVAEAFAARPPLDPPTEALSETVDSIARGLGGGGGLVAELDGTVVGALILDPQGDLLYLRRFGVVPAAQRHGVAHALVAAAAREATGRQRGLAVLARPELPRTVGFWVGNGFVEVARPAPYVEMVRWLPTQHRVVDAEAMRALGRSVAAELRAGDLVLLAGELGAGKTTFTQGLAAGLGVRDGVTSPTFVIARVHPALADGPALVHVDAYRLASVEELDDLDLDAELSDAVTVVEWGAGLAESLADSRLEVRIDRALADEAGDPDAPEDHDPRVVTLTRVGPRWR